MANRAQDIALAIVLMAIGCCWTWLVVETIPPGFGDGEIGPRAFPLTFGAMLLGLSALLLARRLVGQAETAPPEAMDETGEAAPASHWLVALTVLAQIALYGFLLQKIGFLMATPVIVLLVMVVSLRERAFKRLFGMALGLTLGCWLIFEKLLGIYLAKGAWLSLG